jgi:hypothetical protein
MVEVMVWGSGEDQGGETGFAPKSHASSARRFRPGLGNLCGSFSMPKSQKNNGLVTAFEVDKMGWDKLSQI